MSVTTKIIMPVVAPKRGVFVRLCLVTNTNFSRGLLGPWGGVMPQTDQVITVVDRRPRHVGHRWWARVILMNPVVQAAIWALRSIPRRLIDAAGTVSARITLDLAANHEVATIGPPNLRTTVGLGLDHWSTMCAVRNLTGC